MSLRIRRGGVTTGGAPPPESFGPLPSAQAIRDGARPSVVTDPGGGVTFTSRADLVSKIAANPSNTKFVAPGNTTYPWSGDVTDGGKHPRIYFLGDPATCIINGGGYDGLGAINGSNTGGEIHGGTWRNVGTSGAFSSGLRVRAGWTVEDVICENNFTMGISMQANSGVMTLRRAILRNNGMLGVQVTQDTVNTWGPTGCLFENLEIAGNNTRHLNVGGQSGGTKFSAGTRNSIWRKIWAHNNHGAGLWWDGYHSNNLAEDIVSENNRNWGGFVELGFGSNIFRRWYLKDNAVALPTDPNNPESPSWFNAVQFLVSCTNGTQVANTAGGPGTGIAGGTGVTFRDSIIDGTQRAMGAITHDAHPIDTKDIHFLHNQVFLRNASAISGGQVGGGGFDSVQVLWNEIIEFDQNEYHVADVGQAYWRWAGTVGDPRTWVEWLAFGKDSNSSMVVI